MNDLFGKMAEAIGSCFEGFYANLDSLFELAQKPPMAWIDGFPSYTLWTTSKDISLSIGQGVASTIIALFLLFELASLFNRSDTKGLDGIYWILMALLKVAVMLAICKNMTTIIGAIFQVTSKLAQNVSIDASDLTIAGSDIATKVTEYYKNASKSTLLGGYVISLLIYFGNKVCMVLAGAVLKLRLIEIYVLVAIAPIPICTFVSKEYKSIAISYIKRLLALGLQGVLIMIVCYVYAKIVSMAIAELPNMQDVGDMMFQVIGYNIILVIAIFQTGGWAKSLLQVN